MGTRRLTSRTWMVLYGNVARGYAAPLQEDLLFWQPHQNLYRRKKKLCGGSRVESTGRLLNSSASKPYKAIAPSYGFGLGKRQAGCTSNLKKGEKSALTSSRSRRQGIQTASIAGPVASGNPAVAIAAIAFREGRAFFAVSTREAAENVTSDNFRSAVRKRTAK
ncbi:hypothetical protein [Geitlerinema sp. PCC 9228]|uniref:hypothetical protein n=1 Tax=Geitlerinema sp. PCC 9228 TaxID=111611 RepID=UPI001B8C9B9B|nr:hypothetical protein [Geitlerinema sp. PCC 9228]